MSPVALGQGGACLSSRSGTAETQRLDERGGTGLWSRDIWSGIVVPVIPTRPSVNGNEGRQTQDNGDKQANDHFGQHHNTSNGIIAEAGDRDGKYT